MTHPVPRTRGDPSWPVEAVQRLKALAGDGVPAEVISLQLARPPEVIRAKAAELGLSLKLPG